MKTYIAINASALCKKKKTGVEWYSLQLLKYLEQEWNNEDLTVVLFTPKKINFPSKKWRIKVLPGEFLWTQFYLRNFLVKHPPVLLFSPSYVAPLFLPKRIKKINVVHGLEGEYFPQFRKIREIISDYFINIPSLKKSSLLIAVSEHTRKDLNYFYGIPFEKIKTILSGPGSLDNKFKFDSKKTKGTIQFLFLGGSSERKNLELAIRIFQKVTDRISSELVGKETKLIIAGSINKRFRKVLSYGKNNIVLLGYVSEQEKIQQLKNSDFLLYPSYYEGFGFPVLEAQACGTIPVVLKNSGLDEVGGQGIIEFDPALEEKSIDQIVDCIVSSGQHKKLQELGQTNFQKYSWQKCAREIRKILL